MIDLKISDLYFNEGFIKVTGKGNKQRLIPTNLYTEEIINNYIQTNRILTPANKSQEDIVFLNRRGNQLTRVMIYTIIKQRFWLMITLVLKNNALSGSTKQ